MGATELINFPRRRPVRQGRDEVDVGDTLDPVTEAGPAAQIQPGDQVVRQLLQELITQLPYRGRDRSGQSRPSRQAVISR